MPRVNGAGRPWQGRRAAVYWRMGYIIGIIIVLILLPLVFLVISRRTGATGGIDSSTRGVTPSRPSSDQPTPRPGPGVDPKIPPG